MKVLAIFLVLVTVASAQFNPYYFPNRTTMVFLMDWKFEDVAAECENFLGPKGYAGVQVSVPSENAIVDGRPWWERYEVISYVIGSRSGDLAAFSDMCARCNAVGVRVYAEVDINNMGAFANMTGTANNTGDGPSMSFPAVPYNITNFNAFCPVYTYREAFVVRNCAYDDGPDLDQSQDYVRQQIVAFLNSMIDVGCAGFRIAFAKYMWPSDLQAIYGMLNNLNSSFGFSPNCTPFFYYDIIDFGGEAISKWEYTPLGDVTSYTYSKYIYDFFCGNKPLAKLATFGLANGYWDFVPSDIAIVFVEYQNNERSDFHYGQVLNYKYGKPYRMAVAFELAFPFGNPIVMSDFVWTTDDQGPPTDANGDIISPTFNKNYTCGNGWVCQHRWSQIWAMVIFRNVVGDAPLSNFWSDGANQIAFARQGMGFVAFNLEKNDFNQTLQTSLAAGNYCDIITGYAKYGNCTGNTIEVADDGTAAIFISADDYKGMIAIHVEQTV